ncbi:hypothetical protein PACTADRAFT_47843 [Pachysolen tannophilus NRRL Y-2460]|uniref:Uncharacterized protein n=1 Tax=Pachysolen tannophilus NRRL Y-2460 TaxID=669874 RepID=A0A1E4U1Y7_PACTA|nr:hypothetical protein PACTADRAFT_47843 [Pachysolen tannophilus NRRL Y-2460]
MGKTQKKNSKGRLDRYYFLAKEKGYRARSSFKILQINEKYGHFLEKSKVVIDLCAAPGSWCQVASKLCPVNSMIIGVDIVPIKPLPNCITFQSDITTEDCRSKLRGYMKTWKADTVLHDGAPNVGLGWVQDAFTQSQLTLQALKLAVENLAPGGTFVTKIFRSKDYNNLMWVFRQLFDKVEATKPPASRNVSAEIFVVCKNFKAPKKLDPRLLDPKEVFEEIAEGAKNNESKVFNPEKKKRKRDGYEEGDYTQFKTMPLMEWVNLQDDVISILGTMNAFIIDKENPDFKILKKMKQTTDEFYECCKDLKVLGKKDFRMLIKWRKHARELLGLEDEDSKDKNNLKDQSSLVEVEPLTEDQKIDKELQDLQSKAAQKRKREKRKKNESKQKEIQRMQMNMLTDMQIGIDAATNGGESLFDLKKAEKTGQLNDLAKGKKRMIFNNEDIIRDNDITVGNGDNDDKDFDDANSENEVDELEAQLNDMYQNYQERRMEKDANLKAKLARGGDVDDAWEGITETEETNAGLNGDASSDGEFYSSSESDIDSDDDEAINKLVSDLKEQKAENGLSKKAKVFFSDSIFDDVDEEDAQNGKVSKNEVPTNILKVQKNFEQVVAEDDDDGTFEVVAADEDGEEDDNSDNDDGTKKLKSHKDDVDIATVEAMTLAHQVALGQKTKHDLVDEGFNRYSFRDKDGLPDWFLDDENKHSKIVKPTTKEAALAIKEKLKELNARPIKKVMEAQGRKKMRALKRLEKLKRKSDLINDDSEKSERDKAEEITKLMKKLTKKQKTKPKVTLVVASGKNKGLSGRPKGIKGKYKMVDGTLKNEQRALRRIAKKHKK